MCGESQVQPAPSADGPDAASDTLSDRLPGHDVYWPEAAPVAHCTLDNGSDPVGLCVQKLVLGHEHAAAFDPAMGVAESWDASTLRPDEADGGVLHNVYDDVGYGASIARYHVSAGIYGDTEITAMLDADLLKLAPLIESELATPPNEYGGDLYWDLRTVAGGLRFLNRNDEADRVDGIAEVYAQQILDSHFVKLPPQADGGVDDGILGTVLGGGVVAYESADAATGALALLDMASRCGADDSGSATSWQQAAEMALEHVWARARDKSTGMIFRSLMTSGDPDHDALAGDQPQDVLLTDVQATVAFALLRAWDMLAQDDSGKGLVSSFPYKARAETVLVNANGTASLWDGAKGGYIAGYVPSTSSRITDKPTRGNALMLAAARRLFVIGEPGQAGQINPLRALLLSRLPLHASLLSATADQMSYFLAVPSDYDIDAVPVGTTPRLKSYFSRANAVVVEALYDQWYGTQP